MKNYKRGFSLIEVMIGVVILILGFIPVYMLIFSSEKSSIETVRNVEALMYCHTLLEEIKSLPVESVPVTDKISDKKFFEMLDNKIDTKKILNERVNDKSKFFEGLVEVIAEESTKRVKVYVRNKNLSGKTKGKRGETILEYLMLW